MSGGKPISQSETRLEAMQIQSSVYGATIPVVWGVNRIAGNLIWYGGFKAIPVTSSEGGGGKGGGVRTQRTSYRYEASVIMGVCHGPVSGIGTVWKGKQRLAGGPTPTQILEATETFTAANGASYTVANAANAAGVVSLRMTLGVGVDAYEQVLARNVDYVVSNGEATVTLSNPFPYSGTVSVLYQYRQAGTQQTSLQQAGLSFQQGSQGQAALPWLTTGYPTQTLGYSGLAHVGSAAYDLGSGAQVDNHSFEVIGRGAYSIAGNVPDVSAALVGHEILTDGRWGAQFPAARLHSVFAADGWNAYCLASGLLMSPAMTEQQRAADVLEKLAMLTNTAIVWSSGKLRFVPFGDTPLLGNGATYTPNTTPIYDLDDDEFIVDGTEDPIEVEVLADSERYNVVRVEYSNRANSYALDIAEAKDQADIEARGQRVMPTIEARWICDVTVARTVAQLVMQRSLLVQRRYRFRLSWNFALLEPMDLVTLTDPSLGMSLVPVRITEIEEGEYGDLTVVAEDYPLGYASATLYPSQTSAGYQPDYAASAGDVATPIIFEVPGQLTTNGLEIGVAAVGQNANWGGAQVWVSLDGTNYRQIGEIQGGSRQGTTTGAITAGSTSIPVALNTTQPLIGGSAADASALNTLCMLRNGSSTEFFAFTTATLTAAQAYTLGGLVRGAYDTAPTAFPAGSTFLRIDESVARSGLIDLGYVGRTISVKLTSYNIYGGAQQSLGDVPAYTYTITGARIYGNAGADALRDIDQASSDNVLSRIEKPNAILDWQQAQAEVTGILTVADSRGITTERTTYSNAYNALSAHLSTLVSPVPWNDLSADTTIVGTTYRSLWAAYLAAKQALLNRIEVSIVAGENMTRNSSFEVDSTGAGLADFWSPYSTGSTGTVTYSRLNTGGRRGGFYQRITASSLGTADGDRAGFSQTHNVDGFQGRRASWSVWAFPNIGNGWRPRLFVQFLAAGGSTVGTWDSGALASPPAGAWIRHTVTGVIPATAVTAVAYYWIQQSAGAFQAIVSTDDAMFSVGEIVPEWQPRADELLNGVVTTPILAPNAATIPLAAISDAEVVETFTFDGPHMVPNVRASVTWANTTGEAQVVQIEASGEVRSIFTGGGGTWAEIGGDYSVNGDPPIGFTRAEARSEDPAIWATCAGVRQLTVAAGASIEVRMVRVIAFTPTAPRQISTRRMSVRVSVIKR